MKRKTLVYGLILAVMVFSPLLSGCGGSLQEPEPQPTVTSTQEPEPQPTVTPTQELGQWTPVTPLPEALGSGVIHCSDDPDSFYLASGAVGEMETSNRTYRYDIKTATWHRLADMPAPLRFSGLACYQGKIYVAGGLEMALMDVFFIYDIQTDKWSTGKAIPEPVWGAAMGAWDGKLYLVGGDRGESDLVPGNKVDVYDIATQTWTAGGGADMPTASGFYAHVQSGAYLYVVGGLSGDVNANIKLTQRYDMSTNTWELGPTFTSARAYCQLVASSSHLYSAGGDLNGVGIADMTDLVEVLDLSTWPEGKWTNLGRPLPAPNLSFASTCTEVLTGGEIWNVGGANTGEAWKLYSEVYYLPINDTCSDK